MSDPKPPSASRRLAQAQHEIDELSNERDRAFRELEDLKHALDQASIVATTDVKGRITSVNDKFCEVSGYSRRELIGQDHRLINSGYHPPEFIREMWRTIAQGKVWRGQLRNRRKDGGIYWVDTTIVPLLNEDGKPRQYLAIRTEITEQKRVEALLRDKETMAQLGQMAAVIAHEIKNPLAGISGALQVIGRRLGTRPEARVLEDVRSRVMSLDKSLSALLSFARPKRLEAGPTTTRSIVLKSAIVIDNDPAFEQVELVVEGPDLPLVADPDLIAQAVLNLVINAAQANGGGGRVTIEVSEREPGCVAICVLDEGPGLPRDVDIFRPFFTTKVQGTGLGLAVVRQIAEAHGGRVEAKTGRTGGAGVTLHLPVAGP